MDFDQFQGHTPAPDLLELARLGLELADEVCSTFKSSAYSGRMVELARALREKARSG